MVSSPRFIDGMDAIGLPILSLVPESVLFAGSKGVERVTFTRTPLLMLTVLADPL